MQPQETRPSLIVRLTDRRNEPAWAEFVCAYEQTNRGAQTPCRTSLGDTSKELLNRDLLAVLGARD